MNIEGANLLSMMSATDVSATTAPGLLPTSGASLDFSAALLEQLGALQAGLADASVQAGSLQNADFAKLPADAQAAMQSFAVLFGKNLPPAGKVEQNIDLDNTLQALADVMQHLQSFEAPSTVELPPVQAPMIEETLAQQPKPVAIPEMIPEKIQQPPADAGMIVAMTQPQALPIADERPQISMDRKPEHGVDDDKPEVQPTEQAPVTAVVQPDVVVMPQPVADAAAVSEPASASPVLSLSMPMPRKSTSTAGSQSLTKDSLLLPHSVTGSREDFEQEFERSMSALLANGNAAGEQAGKDNSQSNLPKTENLFVALESAGASASVSASATAADPHAVDVSAELGRLHQALPVATNTNVKASMPAVTTPLGKPVWNEDLGQQLIWMHKQAMPSAELRLNPEHLGPVLVKIDVHQDQTSVTFTAQHQVVRDAIEAAIPKLREMFSGQQLQLADVNVSQHQQQSEQRQARDFFQAASEQGRGRQASEEQAADADVSQSQDIADEIEAGRAIAGNGLLSLFA